MAKALSCKAALGSAKRPEPRAIPELASHGGFQDAFMKPSSAGRRFALPWASVLLSFQDANDPGLRIMDKCSYSQPPIYDLCLENTDHLWVATETDLLHDCGGHFAPIQRTKATMPARVRLIRAGRNGEMVCGGWAGLWRFQGGAFQKIPDTERLVKLAVSASGEPWYIDTSQQLFCVTNGAVLKLPLLVNQPNVIEFEKPRSHSAGRSYLVQIGGLP